MAAAMAPEDVETLAEHASSFPNAFALCPWMLATMATFGNYVDFLGAEGSDNQEDVSEHDSTGPTQDDVEASESNSQLSD